MCGGALRSADICAKRKRKHDDDLEPLLKTMSNLCMRQVALDMILKARRSLDDLAVQQCFCLGARAHRKDVGSPPCVTSGTSGNRLIVLGANVLSSN